MEKNPLQRTAARTRDQTKLKHSQNMCLVYMKLFLDITIGFEVLEFSPNFSTEPYNFTYSKRRRKNTVNSHFVKFIDNQRKNLFPIFYILIIKRFYYQIYIL